MKVWAEGNWEVKGLLERCKLIGFRSKYTDVNIFIPNFLTYTFNTSFNVYDQQPT